MQRCKGHLRDETGFPLSYGKLENVIDNASQFVAYVPLLL